MLAATKIRIYPTPAQEKKRAKAFGCMRWFWGEGFGQYVLNTRLLPPKQEFAWLAETYSQVLQSVQCESIAFVREFFERRAKYPHFKSKHGKQTT